MVKGRFAHLPLPLIKVGKPVISGFPQADPRINENKLRRKEHGAYIKHEVKRISSFWKGRQEQRLKEHLPEIETGIPILLEIDPSTNLRFLKGLGFDVVAENEKGYVIVSNGDIEFATLNKKTDDFINEVSARCNTPARIFAFHNDDDRIKKIFGEKLYSIWSSIETDKIYNLDISISCFANIFELDKQPSKIDGQTQLEYETSKEYIKWKEKYYEAYDEWDELKSKREDQFIKFISAYNGEITGAFIDGDYTFMEMCDSFSVRVSISGKCLVDLVYNFSPIFQIECVGDINIGECKDDNQEIFPDDLKIEAPDVNSPTVAVIDSGIQEGHKYIQPAIDSEESRCYVTETTSVYDEVNQGGHGTRVAGAILYPEGIPKTGEYKLPCHIRNIRVLNKENEHSIHYSYFPPLIMRKVVEECTSNTNNKVKIFNHSIAEDYECDIVHMSPWAAEIDKLSYENDILFVQAAGNICYNKIKDYLKNGQKYPQYLFDESSRISSPAQSLQALTVGSICLDSYETEDEISIGHENEPSAFSRTGVGIWNSVKPDVVEFGGTWVKNKHGEDLRLTIPEEVCPELLVRSSEGNAYARDAIGTSFSTPKVSYIAEEIQKLYPNSPALLYRGLIAQSARWPFEIHENFTDVGSILRYVGYGLPNIIRATTNDEYRVTLISEKCHEIYEGEAHIYEIPIPEQLSEIGEDYNIRIDVTLSYASEPRQTRRQTKQYLSTWLDWRASDIGESSMTFANRIFETGKRIDDDGNFNWMIGEQSNYGQARNYSRSYSTLQKDWTVIKSNQLTDGFCIAVRAHKGWNGNIPAKYSLIVSFEAINQDIEIYDIIRNSVEIELDNIHQEEEIEIDGQHRG